MATGKDYSGTPLSQKLGAGPGANVVVFFTTSRAELEKHFDALKATLDPAGGLWIAWPKKAAKIEGDLSFEAVQEIGLARGLVDNKSCSIDERWHLRGVPWADASDPKEGAARVVRTAIFSTYPPRACGIGTFSFDVRASLLGVRGIDDVRRRSSSSTSRRARSGRRSWRRSPRECAATTSARRGCSAVSTSTSFCSSTSTGSSAVPTASTCSRSRGSWPSRSS